MKNRLTVSILCLTYNHEKFIKQALDSFLQQKTDFNFEILINDDASTDGTRAILEAYQKKHPKIIKPVFHDNNQFSRGKRSFFLRYLIPKAKGKYIATCEGDDYWTDPLKLQKQVDFLESHQDYTICFHKINVVYEDGRKSYEYPDVKDASWYTTEELLKVNYIHTSSVMYRKLKYDNVVLDVSPADWYLHLYHASKGKAKIIKECMSTYRKHEAGIWWDYDVDNEQIWRRYGADYIRMQQALLDLFPDKIHQSIIRDNIDRVLEIITRINQKYEDELLNNIVVSFPELSAGYIIKLDGDNKKYKREIDKLWKAIHEQDAIIATKDAEIASKTIELERIKNTLVWKFGSALNKALKIRR